MSLNLLIGKCISETKSRPLILNSNKLKECTTRRLKKPNIMLIKPKNNKKGLTGSRSKLNVTLLTSIKLMDSSEMFNSSMNPKPVRSMSWKVKRPTSWLKKRTSQAPWKLEKTLWLQPRLTCNSFKRTRMRSRCSEKRPSRTSTKLKRTTRPWRIGTIKLPSSFKTLIKSFTKELKRSRVYNWPSRGMSNLIRISSTLSSKIMRLRELPSMPKWPSKSMKSRTSKVWLMTWKDKSLLSRPRIENWRIKLRNWSSNKRKLLLMPSQSLLLLSSPSLKLQSIRSKRSRRCNSHQSRKCKRSLTMTLWMPIKDRSLSWRSNWKPWKLLRQVSTTMLATLPVSMSLKARLNRCNQWAMSVPCLIRRERKSPVTFQSSCLSQFKRRKRLSRRWLSTTTTRCNQLRNLTSLSEDWRRTLRLVRSDSDWFPTMKIWSRLTLAHLPRSRDSRSWMMTQVSKLTSLTSQRSTWRRLSYQKSLGRKEM